LFSQYRYVWIIIEPLLHGVYLIFVSPTFHFPWLL
jgi:hypothetical protein